MLFHRLPSSPLRLAAKISLGMYILASSKLYRPRYRPIYRQILIWFQLRLIAINANVGYCRKLERIAISSCNAMRVSASTDDDLSLFFPTLTWLWQMTRCRDYCMIAELMGAIWNPMSALCLRPLFALGSNCNNRPAALWTQRACRSKIMMSGFTWSFVSCSVLMTSD